MQGQWRVHLGRILRAVQRRMGQDGRREQGDAHPDVFCAESSAVFHCQTTFAVGLVLVPSYWVLQRSLAQLLPLPRGWRRDVLAPCASGKGTEFAGGKEPLGHLANARDGTRAW